MRLKQADDKQPQIDALQSLLTRPDVDVRTRVAIERELRLVRAGVKGEQDAAYEIDFHHANTTKRAVIHDLRLEVAGRVAQIDHLIIDRLLTIWMCESKHFAEGVGVNEHAEWVAFYNGRAHGIPSPIEQNLRHVSVLADAFDQGLVQLPRRLGVTVKPRIRPLVLVSNGARITRPARTSPHVEGLETVIKVERLRAVLDADVEARSIKELARVVSLDSLQRIGSELVDLHQPATVNWPARFGLSAVSPQRPEALHAPPRARSSQVCDACGAAVSAGVARYSAEHASRFRGRILCMSCQREST